MRSMVFGIAALALVGCATGYQQQGFTGGFSEVPLSATTYQITVNGNGFTSASKVKEMGLLRSAELAKMSGYNYFILRGMDAGTTRSTYTTPGSSTTTTTGNATGYVYGNNVNIYGSSTSYTSYNPAQVHEIFKPNVAIVVEFIDDKKAKERNALSVHQIYGLYAEKYGLDTDVDRGESAGIGG